MKSKLVTFEQVKEMLHDGMSVMLGGFGGVGVPERLLDAVIESGVKDLKFISLDSAFPGHGSSRVVEKKGIINRMVVSHIGNDPECGRQMLAGDIDVTLVPMGSLTERIRCGGSGIGGFLTKTGLGTDVEAGKPIINLDGEDWILERPLRADLALIRGSIVDKSGNIVYLGTTQNTNPLMAYACDRVLVEAEKLVETGEIEPEAVVTPGVLVDYIYTEDQ